jgi:hypothetical protein
LEVPAVEPWWHNYYATMVQVISILLLAMVVESRIRSALPSWILIAGFWLCLLGGGLGIWILSEENPNHDLVLAGQWITGLPTAVLVLLIAFNVSAQILRERTRTERPAGPDADASAGRPHGATERVGHPPKP